MTNPPKFPGYTPGAGPQTRLGEKLGRMVQGFSDSYSRACIACGFAKAGYNNAAWNPPGDWHNDRVYRMHESDVGAYWTCMNAIADELAGAGKWRPGG